MDGWVTQWEARTRGTETPPTRIRGRGRDRGLGRCPDHASRITNSDGVRRAGEGELADVVGRHEAAAARGGGGQYSMLNTECSMTIGEAASHKLQAPNQDLPGSLRSPLHVLCWLCCLCVREGICDSPFAVCGSRDSGCRVPWFCVRACTPYHVSHSPPCSLCLRGGTPHSRVSRAAGPRGAGGWNGAGGWGMVWAAWAVARRLFCPGGKRPVHYRGGGRCLSCFRG